MNDKEILGRLELRLMSLRSQVRDLTNELNISRIRVVELEKELSELKESSQDEKNNS